MARTKTRWTATALKQLFRDGGRIVVPLRLSQDPERIVELGIQRSSTEAFVKAFIRTAQPDREVLVNLQTWFAEQVKEELVPASNGKHHQDEF